MSSLQAMALLLSVVVPGILAVVPTAAAAPEKVVLQLKWFHQFQFAGYYAAREKGFYAEEGLEVEIRERDPARVPTDVILAGEAQFGISDSSIVLRRLQGKPLVVLAAVFQRSPLVLMTLDESQIASPLQLIGKRVMFQRNVDDALLTATFAELGIGEGDYTHVPHTFQDDALLTGTADAMSAYVTDQPFYYQSRGHSVNIISPSNYGIDFYGDLLVVGEEYLRRNTDKALAFRRASLKGWAYALDHPEEVIGWLQDRYPSKKSTEHLRFEAESTRRMVLPEVIELGHFNRGRFQRIATIYEQLQMVGADSNLNGIHYLDHLGDDQQLSTWISVLLVVLVLTFLMALVLWAGTRRLKAAVASRTEDLLHAKRALERHIGIVDRYVISSSANLNGTITQVSQALCDISGFSRQELIGNRFSCVRHPQMPRETYRELWQAIKHDRAWSGDLLNRSKSGVDYWIHTMIEPLLDERGVKIGYTAIAQDITDRKRVERLSTTDALTELSNRRRLDDFFEQAIIQASRYQRPLSILIFDIDHFKRVNDEFGHQVGDRLLQQLARLTRERVRETDLLGRWGGEEFLIICPETDLTGARRLAELLHQVIGEHEFTAIHHLSCSFGVAQWQDGETAAQLFRRGDDALYRAKAAGRDRVEVAKP